MKKWISALITAAALAITIGPVAAQSNGPYYATPSWDQQLPPSSRWVTLTNWGNAAVLDRETGLVWQQSPGTDGEETWYDALLHCWEKSIGGRYGWRLPSIEEIFTLIDPANSPPGVYFTGAPFTLPSTGANLNFWASNNAPNDASSALMINGAGIAAFPKTFAFAARRWCVRGYQGAQGPQ